MFLLYSRIDKKMKIEIKHIREYKDRFITKIHVIIPGTIKVISVTLKTVCVCACVCKLYLHTPSSLKYPVD